MSRVLLDTCVVSHYVDRRDKDRCPELIARVHDLVTAQRVALSHVTVYEKRRGLRVQVLRGQGHRQIVRFEMFFRALPILGLDADGGHGWDLAAHLYAQAQTYQPALNPGGSDLLIAATALMYNLPVVTTDEGLGAWMTKLGYGRLVQTWTLC